LPPPKSRRSRQRGPRRDRIWSGPGTSPAPAAAGLARYAIQAGIGPVAPRT